MPIYIYKHPKYEKYIEIFQSINDEHIYIDNNKIKWLRVYTVPNFSIDTKIDEFSQNDYIEKTKNKKGTLGDLLDRSKDLSEKRKKINGGIDPVQEKFFKNYSKQRKNKKHPSDPKRYEKLNKMGASFN
jgi:hypothetical protein